MNRQAAHCVGRRREAGSCWLLTAIPEHLFYHYDIYVEGRKEAA